MSEKYQNVIEQVYRGTALMLEGSDQLFGSDDVKEAFRIFLIDSVFNQKMNFKLVDKDGALVFNIEAGPSFARFLTVFGVKFEKKKIDIKFSDLLDDSERIFTQLKKESVELKDISLDLYEDISLALYFSYCAAFKKNIPNIKFKSEIVIEVSGKRLESMRLQYIKYCTVKESVINEFKKVLAESPNLFSSDNKFNINWLTGANNRPAVLGDLTDSLNGKIEKLDKSIWNDIRVRFVRDEPVIESKVITLNMSNNLNLNVEPKIPQSFNPSFKIFYGPPGTGKTRRAKEEIIKTGSEKNFKIVQIHPSSSYEDLVEGIRPVSFVDGELKYEVVDGAIKIMARKASGDFLNSLCSLKLNESTNCIELGIPLGTTLRYGLGASDLKFSKDKDALIFRSAAPKSDTFEIDIAAFKVKFENVYNKIVAQAEKSGYIYERVFIKDTSWGPTQPYLLILDEVNRGNVASILGEMIYVISEMDSDIGERKKVTLQYSSEDFEWPSNLSLIGTMNSTDISIDRIDQAIKRRFEFEAVNPSLKVFDSKGFSFLSADQTINGYFKKNEIGITPGEVMHIINLALEEKAQKAGYGAFNVKDKLIGHSYFIKFARRVCEVAVLNKLTQNLLKSEIAEQLDKILNNEIKAAMLNIFNGDRDQLEKFIENEIPRWKSNFGLPLHVKIVAA